MSTVELFPVVGLATGTILGAADFCSAGPHSTPRSTNIFVETLRRRVDWSRWTIISTPFIQVYGRVMGATLDASLLVTSVHVIETVHIHFKDILCITTPTYKTK